jgi:UTP---glucose-1-phosphate uridylyltransferase
VLARLLDQLRRIDGFYSSLGGVVGYQLCCLEMIRDGLLEARSPRGALEERGAAVGAGDMTFHLPVGPDLAGDRAHAARACMEGLEALPFMAEVYPLGGGSNACSCPSSCVLGGRGAGDAVGVAWAIS